MAKSTLEVTLRQGTGKGASRALRRAELVPGVVYGKGIEPTAIQFTAKALKAAIATEAGWNTLITLKGEGSISNLTVILKELDLHPIRREIRHADFHTVDMKKKVHVMVPVEVVGKSAGEKAGGSLEVIRKELEVVCLPTNIPNHIEINVEAINIGDVIHVNDLKLAAGIEIPHEVNFTVITCTGRKAEVEETATEEEA